ncbi:Nop15p [Dipodascopsis uninucleata]
MAPKSQRKEAVTAANSQRKLRVKLAAIKPKKGTVTKRRISSEDEDHEEEKEDDFAVFDSDINENESGIGSSEEDRDEDQDEDDDEDEDDESEGKELKFSDEQESELKLKIAEIATSKSSNQTKEKSGVIYIGRIPHGFYEKQMRSYFSQFGDVLRLRLSRNKKTGASKHYAFVEFASSDVAEIVAETMNNYLLYGHILKVSLVPEEKTHDKLFVGSNRKFKHIPRAKLAKHIHDKKRTQEQMNSLVGREVKRRRAKQDRLKALGIDYTLPKSKIVVK